MRQTSSSVTPATRHVRSRPDIGVRLHQREILLVDIPVANRVHESVDAGPEQVLGVFQRGRPTEMGEHLLTVGVCFVDDGPVHVRLELRYGAFPIVNPDLDELHASRVQRLNVFPALLFGRRAVRNPQAGLGRRARHRRCRDSLSHGEEARRIRDHLVAQPIGDFRIGLESHAQSGAHAVVRAPLELIDEVLTRIVRLAVAAIPDVDQSVMVVTVDQGRHHRLAGQVHAHGALGWLTLTLPADPRDGVALDEERGVLDRSAPVADDEPRTLEPGCIAPCLRRTRLLRTRDGEDQTTRQDCWQHS